MYSLCRHRHFTLTIAIVCTTRVATAVSGADTYGWERHPRPTGALNWTVSTPASIFDPDYPGVNRDGGASGTVNGYKMMFFSDTLGVDKNNHWYFLSNTMTYYDFHDPDDPTNQADWGDNATGRPVQQLLNSPSDAEIQVGNRVALWPSSNLTPINSTHVLGCAAIFTNVTDEYSTYVGTTQYIVEPTDNGPVTTRMKDRLWDTDETSYCAFSTLAIQNTLYLFAAAPHVTDGIKLARTPLTDTILPASLEFWDGARWSSSPPPATDPASNLFNHTGWPFGGPYTGDVFYDVFHGCYACVFMESGGGVFWFSHVPRGAGVTGPWSVPVMLARFGSGHGVLVYGGHAHPEDDGEGRGLLLSFSDGGAERRMVRLEWLG